MLASIAVGLMVVGLLLAYVAAALCIMLFCNSTIGKVALFIALALGGPVACIVTACAMFLADMVVTGFVIRGIKRRY